MLTRGASTVIIYSMEIPDIKIAIDWRWVEEHLRSRERLDASRDPSVKDSLLGSLDKAFEVARDKISPRIAMALRKITGISAGFISLEGDIEFLSKELANYLKGADAIYAYIVTIGSGVEEEATSYMNKGDHFFGYLLDRIGSFAVESLAKDTEEKLRKELASKGMSVSMRLSPGYCDWGIEEQFKLAKIIDFSKAGITLTKNCMMVPKKSISAIVGVGQKKLFTKIKSPCASCNILKTCEYRRNS